MKNSFKSLKFHKILIMPNFFILEGQKVEKIMNDVKKLLEAGKNFTNFMKLNQLFKLWIWTFKIKSEVEISKDLLSK